ncbi:hypothetical protein KVV02_008268 [Mortierella alpina]|uniref:Uncharacterized protein n=1 Tax=Mortierella alpina TaxID=64518 RepID=A0A9P8A5A2_MORAP|nr:hypothetical protein KVV02_008268 [Mortierella alpina]
MTLVFGIVTTLLSTTSAQSDTCHACITRSIPLVANCAALTPSSYKNLDEVIHGIEVYSTPYQYRDVDPDGFTCLNALMWDIVYYRATLWGSCLDPTAACSWVEMSHYLEMIPKIASIYGAKDGPPIDLIDPPS